MYSLKENIPQLTFTEAYKKRVLVHCSMGQKQFELKIMEKFCYFD